MKWISRKLEEAYIVKDGTHDSPKYVTNGKGYPLVTSKNLKTGELDLSTVDLISKADFDKINLRSEVHRGDLLFAMIGTIGNPVVVDFDPEFAIKNVALFKSHPDGNSIEYLKYFLGSAKTRRQLFNESNGGTQKFVSLGYLRRLRIPLPSLVDQVRISTILSKAEALIAHRKESLRLLGELLKSTFLEMFGDPVRNEKGWITLPGKDYSDLITVGVVVKPASYYTDTGVIALRSLNIKPNRIDQDNIVYFSREASEGPLAKSVLRTGDVVIVRTGKTGSAAVIPPLLNGYNCIDLIIVRPKTTILNPYYLAYLLNSERGIALVAAREVGGIQKHFNIGAMNKIHFPIPPIDFQKKFAQIVEKVEALKARYQTSLKELENLYGSLSQRAFKGEL
ncbi:MAG: restriction endonuclease subunit S [Thermodesulfovibrionales bacterium]